MTKLLGIVGSVSKQSKTETAIKVALEAAAGEYGIKTELISLADYKLDTADSRKLIEYTGDTAEVWKKIIESEITGHEIRQGFHRGKTQDREGKTGDWR